MRVFYNASHKDCIDRCSIHRSDGPEKSSLWHLGAWFCGGPCVSMRLRLDQGYLEQSVVPKLEVVGVPKLLCGVLISFIIVQFFSHSHSILCRPIIHTV